MALCSTPLTPACEKELIRLTALVPDADLAALVATEPAFQKGGFRAGNLPLLRTRLQQIACGAGEVSPALRRALARRSRAYTLTGLIAVEALTEARHALATLLGAPVLLVALHTKTEETAAVVLTVELLLPAHTALIGGSVVFAIIKCDKLDAVRSMKCIA